MECKYKFKQRIGCQPFLVAYAVGIIKLIEKLELTLSNPKNTLVKIFKENFYLIPNLPHDFLLSRSVFRNLAKNYPKIGKPNDQITIKILKKLIKGNQRLVANISTKPIKQRPYPLNIKHQEEVKKQVKELEIAGIIRKSSSQFAAPVVLVKKERRKLNQFTIRDEWPIPNINDLLKKLSDKRYFQSSIFDQDIVMFQLGK
ncbi:hypothetical protein RFI_25562, partial [Reticulomyxa filosa]